VLEALRPWPSTSLIKEDLEWAERELGGQYQEEKQAGVDSLVGESQRLSASSGAGATDSERVTYLAGLVGAALAFYRTALKPALHLRDHLLSALNAAADSALRQAAKKRRGRKKDPETERRYQKWLEAWESGHYRSYAELARELGYEESTVRKGVSAARRRRGGR
jgi:hypothetical protein